MVPAVRSTFDWRWRGSVGPSNGQSYKHNDDRGNLSAAREEVEEQVSKQKDSDPQRGISSSGLCG